MSGLCVKNLSAGYGARHVVRDLSFELAENRLMGILGANGSGKTTLIKSVCGILPCKGDITFDGVSLKNMSPGRIARLCGYIPQRSGIAIDISVMDVVLMGFNPRLKLLEHPDAGMKARAREALTQVGLAGRGAENYLHLSEGQKQLCILARTLAADSRLLLLDEPESALDFRFRYRMLQIIRDWTREAGRCAAVALHDPQLALNYCDELMLMRDGGSIGVIRPDTDAREYMEEMLSWVYGPVSLASCTDRSGRAHMIMLKEREEDL